MENLSTDNKKTLLREIKEGVNKWMLWIRRLHIFKMPVFSKLIYRFDKFQIKIPTDFLVEMYIEILARTISK